MDLLETHSLIFLALITFLGIIVGSFLNVVIYRIPIVLKNMWQQQCQELFELPHEKLLKKKSFNLLYPRSHCPICQHKISFYQNIPLISYLLLRGKCANCNHNIAFSYPLVELGTGLLSFVVAWHFGVSLQMVMGLIFTWTLICLAIIDIQHQFLPDILTLPLLWLGLSISILQVFITSEDAIIAALAGYLILWIIFWIFKFITGKDGLGYGDFKLLACIGTFVGWQVLPITILISSFLGGCVGIILIYFKNYARSTPIAYGPYLAIAGWITLLWGKEIINGYLHFIGLQ